MEARKTLVALDIDGVLKGFGGLISKDTIDRLLNFAHVGIVSGRGDAHEIARKLGLGFAEIGKGTALAKFARTYPNHLGRTYIANTEFDRKEAELHGWNFVNANDIKLNLASGEDIKKGYINTDIREIQGINIVIDHEKYPLPFEDGIVSEIILKDFLEHISWRKTRWFLAECHRVLKPNGKIYIQCPDLEVIAKKIILNPDFEWGGIKQPEAIGFWVYGRQDDPATGGWGGFHKAGFTIPILSKLLAEIGFTVDRIENNGGSNILCWARKKP
jgi:SAM-dependent methyltransferase